MSRRGLLASLKQIIEDELTKNTLNVSLACDKVGYSYLDKPDAALGVLFKYSASTSAFVQH